MKILGNLWQSSDTFGNLRKQFKSVFHRFYDFLKFSEILRKSSEAFGNLRKFAKNFGNGSKVIFRCFHDFFKIFGISSEVFGNFRKTSETVQK